MPDTPDTFGFMYMVQPDGGDQLVDHDADLLCFEHNGVAITNPMVDESTIAPVDPRKYYGFTQYDAESSSGLRKDLKDGSYLLLTDQTGTALPDFEQSETARLHLFVDGRHTAHCQIGDIP